MSSIATVGALAATLALGLPCIVAGSAIVHLNEAQVAVDAAALAASDAPLSALEQPPCERAAGVAAANGFRLGDCRCVERECCVRIPINAWGMAGETTARAGAEGENVSIRCVW